MPVVGSFAARQKFKLCLYAGLGLKFHFSRVHGKYYRTDEKGPTSSRLAMPCGYTVPNSAGIKKGSV